MGIPFGSRMATRTGVTRWLLVGMIGAAAGSAFAAPEQEAYTWQNVRIDGGGFVPGIVFNETEPNLIYARTDIGGLYRWNEAKQRWLPLLDWVGWDNWGWNGVLSVATDPVEPDRVYAAVGMYTNSWDPNNGAILRSADRGASWEVTELPFKNGGNMPGRGMGERLQVDPNDNRILYFATEAGNGLWRSENHGETWSKVEQFPNVGNHVEEPNDPYDYQNVNVGLTWVAFNSSSGEPGAPTPEIFVGVADKENPLYRSRDAGATWERIPGQPTGFLPHKGLVDPVNGLLYVATSNRSGPYTGTLGEVWRFDIANGEWTDISPVPASDGEAYFGYTGLTIDRQNPDTLIVASQVSWWPDAQFYRTNDRGETWTPIWEWTFYPERELRYEMDISEVPWLTFGNQPQPPEVTPKLGWMNEGMQIDPHNPDRLMYGTGATIYGTENLTAWDEPGGKVLIRPMVRGLEETAVLDLASPPEGPPLFSALGDIGGFRHDDLTRVPNLMYQSPFMGNTTSIDFAEFSPSIMVRVGNVERDGNPNPSSIAISNDGGQNWWAGQEPGGVTGGGTVAVSADGGAIVWSPEGTGVHYSTSMGGSWQRSQGVPNGAVIGADRVNPRMFYAFTDGAFYVSTDGGASFQRSDADGLPQQGARRFKAVPGREGDIWLAGGSVEGRYGLWRSTDTSASFQRLTNVEQADNVGFGKHAPGRDYHAVYIVAQVDGVRGVFRSDDEGGSWVRINDDAHQYGNHGDALTGDPRRYGRVYLGTNGRGVIYGDPVTQDGDQPGDDQPGDDQPGDDQPGDESGGSSGRKNGGALHWGFLTLLGMALGGRVIQRSANA